MTKINNSVKCQWKKIIFVIAVFLNLWSTNTYTLESSFLQDASFQMITACFLLYYYYLHCNLHKTWFSGFHLCQIEFTFHNDDSGNLQLHFHIQRVIPYDWMKIGPILYQYTMVPTRLYLHPWSVFIRWQSNNSFIHY
jgi:hypothetical protein